MTNLGSSWSPQSYWIYFIELGGREGRERGEEGERRRREEVKERGGGKGKSKDRGKIGGVVKREDGEGRRRWGGEGRIKEVTKRKEERKG